ncbi:MAG: glutamate 5-kinase [bacterium]|nr:glutamate 5-kinase [bacterium]
MLTRSDGSPALSRLFSIVEAAADLRARGREVIVVSSGAVGFGVEALGHEKPPESLDERQACAAVGQTRLMGLYREGFSRYGLECGQVLLTQGDFDDRMRYLNLRSTMAALLRHGVVPIVNENDAVSTEELAFVEGESRHVFGDNDKLSALVASKLDAELLVMLTDVDGVYDRDPRKHRAAKLLNEVREPDGLAVSGQGSALGRGGMRSKVGAATIATLAGCHAVIASGLDPGALRRVLVGEIVGTWFPAGRALDARQRWIAFAAAPRGSLELDAGAVTAIRKRRASVLAAGVTRCEGEFKRGDVVELHGPGGAALGRGIVFCDAPEARRWCAGERPSGVRNHDALVHRDHLVLEE